MSDGLLDLPVVGDECTFAEGLAGREDGAVVGWETRVYEDPVSYSTVLCERYGAEVGFSFEVGGDTEGGSPAFAIEGPGFSFFSGSGMGEMEERGVLIGERVVWC